MAKPAFSGLEQGLAHAAQCCKMPHQQEHRNDGQGIVRKGSEGLVAQPAKKPAAAKPKQPSRGGPAVLRPEKFGSQPRKGVKPQPKPKPKRAASGSPLVQATEKILDDFIREHPDAATANKYIGDVFDMTEVNRSSPSIKGMLTVIDPLAEDEAKRLGMKVSRKNKRNRMLIIKESIG